MPASTEWQGLGTTFTDSHVKPNRDDERENTLVNTVLCLKQQSMGLIQKPGEVQTTVNELKLNVVHYRCDGNWTNAYDTAECDLEALGGILGDSKQQVPDNASVAAFGFRSLIANEPICCNQTLCAACWWRSGANVRTRYCQKTL